MHVGIEPSLILQSMFLSFSVVWRCKITRNVSLVGVLGKATQKLVKVVERNKIVKCEQWVSL